MIDIGRRVVPWLVGPAVLLFRGSFVELAPPNRCPGLLELISIAAVRTWPDLSIGALFTLLHALSIIVGLAVFVELLRRTTRNLVVAVAIGLAAALGPMFANNLAPPWEAAAFAAAATATLLSCGLRGRLKKSVVWFATVYLFVLLATALVIPVWTVAAALAAGFAVGTCGSRFPLAARWLAGSATALAFIVLVMFILDMSRPDLFAASTSWRAVAVCALPRPSIHLAGTLGVMWWLIGPLGLALALLGAFVAVERLGVWRGSSTALAAMISLVLVAGAAMSGSAVLAPWVVGLWWLAASGLSEVVRAPGQRSRAWLTGCLLLVLLPALQAARVAREECDDRVRPLGHERMTLRHMRAILNSVNSEGKLVEEDSTVDVLLRAAVAGRRRTPRKVTIVPRDSDAIRNALNGAAVYAFPLGQNDLSYRGFAFEPVTAIAFRGRSVQERITGVAAITGWRSCQVVGDTWIELSDPTSNGRVALAADSETAYGPVAIYLGSEKPSEPQPDNWPARATRGFRFTLFDQRSQGQRERLLAEAREMGLADHPILSAPSVVRLLLHRTPRAPRQLAVTLGVPFTSGVARLADEAAKSGHLTVCDAPPIQIQPFASHVD